MTRAALHNQKVSLFITSHTHQISGYGFVDAGVYESVRAAERRSPACSALALVMLHPRCSFSNSTVHLHISDVCLSINKHPFTQDQCRCHFLDFGPLTCYL